VELQGALERSQHTWNGCLLRRRTGNACLLALLDITIDAAMILTNREERAREVVYTTVPRVAPILNSCRCRVHLLAIAILHGDGAFDTGVSTSGAKHCVVYAYNPVPTARVTFSQV
jgi:hypothetical protein